MTYELTAQQQSISDAIAKICAQFGDEYWLERLRFAPVRRTFCPSEEPLEEER